MQRYTNNSNVQEQNSAVNTKKTVENYLFQPFYMLYFTRLSETTLG